ncbi:hypothetical protein D8I24_4975 [Cupriavidus necator H850]|nr:hypothetical protein D8I24_4975 [Cupriavidus necator H850]
MNMHGLLSLSEWPMGLLKRASTPLRLVFLHRWRQDNCLAT